MRSGVMPKAEFIKAAYGEAGQPRGDGPICVTCNTLAAHGLHSYCQRRRGNLVVWVGDSRKLTTVMR